MKRIILLYTFYILTFLVLHSSVLCAQKPVNVIIKKDKGGVVINPDKKDSDANGFEVEIICNVPNAAMYIDGIRNGDASGSRFLKKGKHIIKLEAEEYYDTIEEFVVNKKHKSFTFIMKGTEFAGKTASQLYNVGEDFYYGRNGKSQNYTEAVKWYEKAAGKGDISSCYSLGFIYNNGKGVLKDSLRAMSWYEMAAKQGHAGSQNNLAVIYYYAKDYSSAFKWFKLAAEQDDCTSLDWLGTMYEKGCSVPCDTIKAIECYKKSARLYFESKKYERAFNVFAKAFGLKKEYSRKKVVTGTIRDARTILLKKYSGHFGKTIKEEKTTPYDRKEYIMDLEEISSYALYATKFDIAEKYTVEGIDFSSENMKFNSNLAVSLLLQGKFYDAEKIYRKRKNDHSQFLKGELEAIYKAGIVPKGQEADVEIIKKLLSE